MSDKDFVEQWVVLAREGEYQVGKQRFVITHAALLEMAGNFKAPLPVLLSERALESPDTNPMWPSSRCEIIAVEVRRDSRGHYLAGQFRSPSVTISFVTNARNRTTGLAIGARINDAIFTGFPLSPIESATDPTTQSESASPARTQPDSR
jgi:hypothetical protein